MLNVEIYTDAPREYDYPGTREIDPAVAVHRSGRTWRKVAIPSGDVTRQCMRYSAGAGRDILDFGEYRRALEIGILSARPGVCS